LADAQQNMAIHNNVANEKKIQTATTTYVYDGLEGILGEYLMGGTQQYASLESFSWS
jgi:hypothetical protein